MRKFIVRYWVAVWLTLCLFFAAAGPLVAIRSSSQERARADHVVLLQIRRQCERQNIRVRGIRGLWRALARLVDNPGTRAIINARVDKYLVLHRCGAITLEDSSGILSKSPPR